MRYDGIPNDCDIAVIYKGRVTIVRPPSRTLVGLKHVDIKCVLDHKSLPETQGNYWIATDEVICHLFHPGKINVPRPLKNKMNIVYNGITTDIRGRIMQHLLRKGGKGMSGIYVDLLRRDEAECISHTKLAWHQQQGKRGIYTDDGERLQSPRQLHMSCAERRWVSKARRHQPIYFKNGIDVGEHKHRGHVWRVYYMECPNKFVNDIVEKQWRRLYGLPRLCTYSEAR